MKRLLLAIAILMNCVYVSEALAAQIDGNYVGCTTQRALNEVIQASVNRDYRQIEALLGTECININGLEYSIVRRGFVQSQIRVYAGNSSILLWTVSEALRN